MTMAFFFPLDKFTSASILIPAPPKPANGANHGSRPMKNPDVAGINHHVEVCFIYFSFFMHIPEP